MGGCASADDNADEYEIEEDDDAKLDAAEKATAMADRLSTEVKESQGVLDARKQDLVIKFKEVISRPRVKPEFDASQPDAHLPQKVDDSDEDQGEDADEEENKPRRKDDSDDDSDGEGGAAQSAVAKKPKLPKHFFEPELWDMMELVGNKEVAEEVQTLFTEMGTGVMPDMGELLARADEPADSEFPWCQAHFLRVCGAAVKETPGTSPPMPYIAAVLGLRSGMDHLRRCPAPIRAPLAEDVANLYFDDKAEPNGVNRIGIELNISTDLEAAIDKLTNMSDMGIGKVLERIEERLSTEIVPAYLEAYHECGDKSAEVYPEETKAFERNYPTVPEGAESDEDAVKHLSVIIEKIANVKIMDPDEGTSDPFCKLELGDESFFTNVRRATLNPYWGDEAGHFKFEVDYEERKTMHLNITVYDEDDDGEVFIGQWELPVADLPENKFKQMNEYLCDEDMNQDKSLGELCIKVRIGDPIDDEMMPMDDCIFAPRLLRESYPVTNMAIVTAATKMCNARRYHLANNEVRGIRNKATAEGNALEKAALKLQNAWRAKLRWRRIINFKKKMTTGATFQKISRKGVREPRHVYCPPDLRSICWNKEGSFFGADSIPIDDVKAVVVGRTTKAFMTHDKHPATLALMNQSFSIITRDRSLDLECEPGERADWLDALAFWLRDHLKESALRNLRKH